MEVARKMGDAIRHRGPDDQGVWNDQNGNYLVHRRLSILDLSPSGHQPMVSRSGRFVISFNGEIYNYQELKQKLADRGIQFRGTSDTEVLLEGIAADGLENTLASCEGMFAFALWDKQAGRLILARDRVGEKPLYYGWWQGQFLFASELKALMCVPGFSPDVDVQALGSFFKYNYVPAPQCIYRGIRKLPAGHWAEIDPAAEGVKLRAYWRYPEPLTIGEGLADTRNHGEITNEFHRLLKQSVGQQMRSDVPLGSFLSGGLDSSLVTALMQAQSAQPVRTFTIGFHEKDYDESVSAKEIAGHLGCRHTEWIVSAGDVKSLIPEIPRIYDEPFSDSSQLPSCLLAAMTAKEVKVVLSGDGGDELMGGYNRYLWTEKIWKKMNRVPQWFRQLSTGALNSLSEETWQFIYRAIAGLLPVPAIDGFGHKTTKLARVLNARSVYEAYDLLVSHWHQPGRILSGSVDLAQMPEPLAERSVVDNMMWLDSQTYLPDDLMVKVDRATMASSLESRAPFLNHKLIEFSARVPLRHKIVNGQSKALMRGVLKQYVPEGMLDRPKKGFSVPIAEWLRGDLKPWAEDLLSPANLKHGYLNVDMVEQCWREHKSGRRNLGLHLWDILVFQMWYSGLYKS